MISNFQTPTAEGGVKPMLVPKLRFPEFREAEGWETGKVDDLVDTVTPPKKLPTTLYASSGAFPIIDQSQSDICGWTNDNEALIREHLPLIVFGDHTCILKLIAKPFAQGADGIKILKTGPKLGTPYLYQFLSYRPVTTEEYKRHYAILKEKIIYFPEFKSGEQQKIAECLSSVDELIAAQARKVDALKTHKKGLMQQLFPHEGETQPRLRFPEFKNAGEWEEQKLEDLAKRGSGHTPNKAKQEYYNGGIKWVSLADSKRLDNGLISETAIVISEQGIKNSSAVLHPAGSVILSRDAGVGKSAVMSESMAVSQHFIVWTCYKHRLSHWFLYYILQIIKPVF
jgi:type I restriction enzyme, S subunit